MARLGSAGRGLVGLGRVRSLDGEQVAQFGEEELVVRTLRGA